MTDTLPSPLHAQSQLQADGCSCSIDCDHINCGGISGSVPAWVIPVAVAASVLTLGALIGCARHARNDNNGQQLP